MAKIQSIKKLNGKKKENELPNFKIQSIILSNLKKDKIVTDRGNFVWALINDVALRYLIIVKKVSTNKNFKEAYLTNEHFHQKQKVQQQLLLPSYTIRWSKNGIISKILFFS